MALDTSRRWWCLPSGIVFVGFLAIAGFFLFTEHKAHVLGALPFLLLLACPLMHLMHGGHGGHGRHPDEGDRREARQRESHER